MKLHGNAALTPNQRLSLARRVVEQDWSLGEAAEAAEVASARPTTSYIFVTDGIEAALHRAQEGAGSQVVLVNGGAKVARQFLNAGLLDEVRLHLVPLVRAWPSPCLQAGTCHARRRSGRPGPKWSARGLHERCALAIVGVGLARRAGRRAG